MKILLLTNSEHKEFVQKFIDESVSLYYGDGPFFGTNYVIPEYDIGISFMYKYKVPYQYELEDHPWINFHPGPLPKYRGRNLCYHALMNGEYEFGASIHYMDEGFDTGDIIDVWTFPILLADTADSLSKMAMQTSYRMFEEYLPRIASGEEFPRIENIGGMYYKKEPINDFIDVREYTKAQIRAITYGKFYPKINIGGDIYKVVKE